MVNVHEKYAAALSRYDLAIAVAGDYLFFPVSIKSNVGESCFRHLEFELLTNRLVNGGFYPDLKIDSD
jgi:hypothetical protein